MMRLPTNDRLYLHGYSSLYGRDAVARFFINADPENLKVTTDILPIYSVWSEGTDALIISNGQYSSPPVSYGKYHDILHGLLERECPHRENKTKRRFGRDGWYGHLIRYDLVRTNTGCVGCAGTPLIDIDAVCVDDCGKILKVIEKKRQYERINSFQGHILNHLHVLGIPVELVEV
jgi:hypothetical protein